MATLKIIISLVVLTILTWEGVHSLVDVNKYGRIESNIEGFEKYCKLAKEAQDEYVAYQPTSDDDPIKRELREHYLKINTVKMLLGAKKLNVAWCLDEAYEKAGQREPQLREDFEALCEKETEADVFCAKAHEDVMKGQGNLKAKRVNESEFCKMYHELKRKREWYHKFHNLQYCDPVVVNPVEKTSKANAAKVLDNMVKEIEGAMRRDSEEAIKTDIPTGKDEGVDIKTAVEKLFSCFGVGMKDEA